MPSRSARTLAQALALAHSLSREEQLEDSRRSIDRVGVVLPLAPGVTFAETELAGMPVAWIRPIRNERPGRVILYIHGGGFYSGSLPYTRLLGSRLAHFAGTDVLSFAYRLAPENPFPAQLEDTIALYRCLLDIGYTPGRIAFAGDSAGGNMTLASCHMLRGLGLPLPAALVGMSPWTDLTCSFDSYHTHESIDPTTAPSDLPKMAQLYAEGQDLANPLISPYFGDFSGFPPTLLQVGLRELIVDDVRRTGQKMREQGVRAYTHGFTEMWHVFQAYGVPESRRAFGEIGRFLKLMLRA